MESNNISVVSCFHATPKSAAAVFLTVGTTTNHFSEVQHINDV